MNNRNQEQHIDTPFLFEELPRDCQIEILSFVQENQAHANFRKLDKNSRQLSNAFWLQQFNAQFKDNLKYYDLNDKQINWHHEYFKWLDWNKFITAVKNSAHDGQYIIAQQAILLRMPFEVIQSCFPFDKDEHFKLSGFVNVFSVNDHTIDDINFLVETLIRFACPAETIIHSLLSHAVHAIPSQKVFKFNILLDPACRTADLVRKIIAEPTNVSWLISALNDNCLPLARLLLENGCSANQIENNPNSYYRGKTPVHFTISHYRLEATKLLVEFGGKVGNEGSQLLLYAIQTNNVAWVNFALACGVDLNAHDLNPLTSAISERNALPIIEALLKHGANPYEESSGLSVIEIAALSGKMDIVLALLKAKVKLYIEKTEARPEDNKATHVKLSLFGKSVELGFGYAAGQKLNIAKLFLEGLEGNVDSMRIVANSGEARTGELSVIFKEAKKYGFTALVNTVTENAVNKPQ